MRGLQRCRALVSKRFSSGMLCRAVRSSKRDLLPIWAGVGGRVRGWGKGRACPSRWHLFILLAIDLHDAKVSKMDNTWARKVICILSLGVETSAAASLSQRQIDISMLAWAKRKKTGWHQSCRYLHMQRCIRLLQLQNELIICKTVVSTQARHFGI